MKKIDKVIVQQELDRFQYQDVYIHVETTNGAYAAHLHNQPNVGVFIRNAKVPVEHAKITGEGPYRVGVKLTEGWVYAEGLTSFDIHQNEQLLLYGFDAQGKLAVALQLSLTPFGQEVTA